MTDAQIYRAEFGPDVAAHILKIIATARGIKAVQAGLPGSSGSSKADERTNEEHNGAQEHNASDQRPGPR